MFFVNQLMSLYCSKYYCYIDRLMEVKEADLPLDMIHLTVLWLGVGEREPAFPVKEHFNVCDD